MNQKELIEFLSMMTDKAAGLWGAMVDETLRGARLDLHVGVVLVTLTLAGILIVAAMIYRLNTTRIPYGSEDLAIVTAISAAATLICGVCAVGFIYSGYSAMATPQLTLLRQLMGR